MFNASTMDSATAVATGEDDSLRRTIASLSGTAAAALERSGVLSVLVEDEPL